MTNAGFSAFVMVELHDRDDREIGSHQIEGLNEDFKKRSKERQLTVKRVKYRKRKKFRYNIDCQTELIQLFSITLYLTIWILLD